MSKEIVNETPNPQLKTIVFLNNCILGEDTKWEVFFAYLKKKSWKPLFQAKNKEEIFQILNENKNLVNFNNLFLRKEVVQWIHDHTDKEDLIYVVSDFTDAPIHLLEINRTCKLLSYADYKTQQFDEHHSQLVTGEFLINYKNFFKCKKVLFVGPFILGKIVNSLTVGRTDIFSQPYGIFSIIWDYCMNFFTTLEVLWPLLFFFPSSNFALWIKIYILSTIVGGIGFMWRTLLELEEERKCIIEKKEVLFGGNFLFLHHSTSMTIFTSLAILYMVCVYGCGSLVNLKALVYSLGYGIMQFLFLTRTLKEKIIAKFVFLIGLTILIQPSVVGELCIFFGKKTPNI